MRYINDVQVYKVYKNHELNCFEKSCNVLHLVSFDDLSFSELLLISKGGFSTTLHF